MFKALWKERLLDIKANILTFPLVIRIVSFFVLLSRCNAAVNKWCYNRKTMYIIDQIPLRIRQAALLGKTSCEVYAFCSQAFAQGPVSMSPKSHLDKRGSDIVYYLGMNKIPFFYETQTRRRYFRYAICITWGNIL